MGRGFPGQRVWSGQAVLEETEGEGGGARLFRRALVKLSGVR
jgi:hypothetical protein